MRGLVLLLLLGGGRGGRGGVVQDEKLRDGETAVPYDFDVAVVCGSNGCLDL